jgi:hypothetical protein
MSSSVSLRIDAICMAGVFQHVDAGPLVDHPGDARFDLMRCSTSREGSPRRRRRRSRRWTRLRHRHPTTMRHPASAGRCCSPRPRPRDDGDLAVSTPMSQLFRRFDDLGPEAASSSRPGISFARMAIVRRSTPRTPWAASSAAWGAADCDLDLCGRGHPTHSASTSARPANRNEVCGPTYRK